MPLRPDLSTALNLSRRPTATPVKLPRMSFPMVGGPAELGEQTAGTPFEARFPEQEPLEVPPMSIPVQPSRPEAPPPLPDQREAGRVVVYGRSGCEACLEAVQDLVDRQVSFAYFDVDRDALALQHLQVVCGGEPVVPVIIYIGFRTR